MDSAPHKLPTAPAWIDIHSHVLPGIDDGCRSLDESLVCIRRLKERGFVGTVCTPHVWPRLFPSNTRDNIRLWVDQLRQRLREADIQYHLWAGGEVRMFHGLVDWLKEWGVPTLGESNCVLTDFWEDDWPDYAEPAYEWMLSEGYQPILAHPSRLGCREDLPEKLPRLREMGVWLQGNVRCLTGEDGYWADILVRQFLDEDMFELMALDMHRPADLEARLEGMGLVEKEYGRERLVRYMHDAPRKMLGIDKG